MMQPHAREEVVYQDGYGITVTTARIVAAGGTVLPLASVVAARTEDEPRPFGAALAIGAGVFVVSFVAAAAYDLAVLSWGVAGAAGGIAGRLVLDSAPKRNRVRAFTSAGGFDVVSTADKAHAEAVAAAIGRALAARG